ncbi:MAG: hypothetical protein O3B87_01225 [bacterium]|nr:hypothetical protein [bacterium]
MNNPSEGDLYERIHLFQQEILTKRPARQDMYHEVRMMNFKVRPVVGDISQLDFGNTEFIDALWSIGKLDEFFRIEIERISKDEKKVFFDLVDEMRKNFQLQLNKANITSPKIGEEKRSVFEVEIIKEHNSSVH